LDARCPSAGERFVAYATFITPWSARIPLRLPLVNEGAKMPEPNTVIDIKNLHVSFFTEHGELRVVEDISFSIDRGETLALVGESGCGKSVTALAIMRLIDEPGRITQGAIMLGGQDLVQATETEMQRLRGRRIGMIFQEPMTSLNPVLTIGDQIAEVLLRHLSMGRHQARRRVLELLELVRLPSPARRMDQYPHELSGGMKQRTMIAMAIACKPDLLIADEPTTALDVTIQAQILSLLKELQSELGMAILLITHNLGVVAHFARRVLVMYAGNIVEAASVRPLFKSPFHPYTRALLRAIPNPLGKSGRLFSIAGSVPGPLEFPEGCRFSTRCPEVMTRCAVDKPPRRDLGQGQYAHCWLDPTTRSGVENVDS
jgi:oligopeptide/dipeptide ABC transporter ATP-binding protein